MLDFGWFVVGGIFIVGVQLLTWVLLRVFRWTF